MPEEMKKQIIAGTCTMYICNRRILRAWVSAYDDIRVWLLQNCFVFYISSQYSMRKIMAIDFHTMRCQWIKVKRLNYSHSRLHDSYFHAATSGKVTFRCWDIHSNSL